MYSSFGYRTRILFTVLLTVSSFFLSVHINKLSRKRPTPVYRVQEQGLRSLLSLPKSQRRPKTCLVENVYEPEGVIFLHPANTSTELRNMLRTMWRKVEVKCQYKIIFIAFDSEPTNEPDKLENTLFLNTSNEAQNIGDMQQWIKQKCKLAKYFGFLDNVTENSLSEFAHGGTSFRILPGTVTAPDLIGAHFNWCMAKVPTPREESISDLGNYDLLSITDTDAPIIEMDSEAQTMLLESLPADRRSILLKEDQGKQINSNDFQYIINQAELCTDSLKNSPPFAFIAVHSAIHHFDLREEIRSTWGNPELLQRLGAVLLFFLGLSDNSTVQQEVVAESARHRDVIQQNYTDHYRQLTLKHTGIFQYFTSYCDEIPYQFLMKTDDDVVIDLETTLSFLKNLTFAMPNITKSIYCFHLEAQEKVPRKKSFKWYITYEEYPGETYPPFCYGNGYLFTKDLVRPVYDMAVRTPQLWVDDAYFTGFVARNIKEVHRIQLPHQRPILPKVMTPEEIIEGKKWMVHTWGDATVFDTYWTAFQSRHNDSIKKIFLNDIYKRTGTNLSDSLFDIY
ncbi:uncharacterized protein LOC129585140 [Paramacrobiotus metropolitanus]|uniref:uncharacterized protein LOC129585140 n=1 Tax=Paramacrobiotus metropolitanus TaxID=2943436 RepID=UPI0024459DD6|nr:uncharacterized protein LOC129585140 [Paramacrobiotus metropolitanus]